MWNFLFETFRLGLKNLRLHKLRSLLTALGIIIGVAAFIIMVAIGEGSKQAALEQIQQLGARNILIRSVRPPESTEASTQTQRVLEYGLKRSDLERLSDPRVVPGLEAVVPLRDTEQRVVRGDIRAQANAIGTTPLAFDVINLKLSRGMYFTQFQHDRAEPVCVIGNRVSTQLFPYEDPLGQQVRVGTGGYGTVVLTVIGVLEPSGLRAGPENTGILSRDLDEDLYMPLTLAQKTFGDVNQRRLAGTYERKKIELTEVWLKAKDIRDVERIAGIAENAVIYGSKPGELSVVSAGPRQDVQVKAPISILRAAERTQREFNIIMGGLASFALLVGGIGIMNIMLASVTERTREIGIRRALGAKRGHITLQFLIETTVISLSGGLIGMALGSGGAKTLPPIVRFFGDGQTSMVTAIALWSVVGAFVVSAMIGIIFGLYPAVVAARMNPIEALRHE